MASPVLVRSRVGDFEVLLARDHAELDRYVRLLITTDAFTREWWLALDGARLAFAAHAEATEHVVGHLLAMWPTLRGSIPNQVITAHGAQERLIQRLFENHSDRSRLEAEAVELRAQLLVHDEHHRLIFSPTLRCTVDDFEYARLAGLYATARVRAISQLRPLVIRSNRTPRPGTDMGIS